MDKMSSIPEEVGRDAKGVAAFQRQHTTFEYELARLSTQVMLILEWFSYLLFIFYILIVKRLMHIFSKYKRFILVNN